MKSVLVTATFAFALVSKPNLHLHSPYVEASHACAKEMNELDFWNVIAWISSRMDLSDILENLAETARHKKTAIERLKRLATHPDPMIREQTNDFLRKKLSYAWTARSQNEREYFDSIARALENALNGMERDEAKDTARQITGHYVRNRKWDELMVLVVEHPDQQIRLEVRLAIDDMAKIPSYRREMPKEILLQTGIDRPD